MGEHARLEDVPPEADAVATPIETARDGRRRRPVLVVACDGAHAPTRHSGGRRTKRGSGEWREVKGFRPHLLGPEGRIVHVASWQQIADKATLSEAQSVVAARIPHAVVRVALVADGSDWIWDVFQTRFPDCEPVLDCHHCADRVHETALAQCGEGTLEAPKWAEAILTRLGDNEVGAVVGGLLRMKPRTPAAEDSIRLLSIYLAEQQDRVGYRELRRRGLLRGSGGVNSANRLISHVQLKRSDAWWLEAKGNAMLRIRCALYNGTVDRMFADYMAIRRGPPSP